MIGKRKRMSKNNEIQQSTVNLFCEGTVVTGDIEAPRDIRLDGYLNGKLTVNGKVVIGGPGKLQGDVFCKTIDLSGCVEGNVNASEMVTLKSTARILGNIITEKIAVEPGACFTGSCKMGEKISHGKEKKG